MRYLLDTNIIIEAVGGSSPAVVMFEQAVASDWVGYSAITRLELFGYPHQNPRCDHRGNRNGDECCIGDKE